MLNGQQTRRIDLTVPTGWNQCSTAQLEQIARILLRRMAMQDRYHPYDPMQMKTEAFFALAGLTVVEAEGDDTFLVRLRQTAGDSRSPLSFIIHHLSFRKRPEPFPLKVWQVHSFVNQHLGWLDDFTGLWVFPYPDLGSYPLSRWSWVKAPLRWLGLSKPLPRLEGPAPLLDGMTWRQYRFANDWISAYVDGESPEAREGFLKALFDVIDLPTTPRPLRRLRADQFQVILIWWQSMMAEMQKKYRRCFKTSKTAGRQQPLPIDLYTRSTATLQDKYHLTEDEINRQPCRVILQHLEDMAQEAEELEKINRKHKK